MKRRNTAKRYFQRLAAIFHVIVEFTTLRLEYFHLCTQ